MNYFHIALILFLNINIFLSLESQSFDESLYAATWSTSNVKTLSKNFPPINLSDNSLRQIFRVSTSGENLRVKSSNRYGNTILKIRKVIISDSVSQETSEIDIETIKVLTFSGKEKINIEPGSEIYSDTIEYNLKALSEVAISIYFGIVPTDLTGYENSITNSFIEEGDKITNKIFSSKNKTPHWYFVESIEVVSKNIPKTTIVCFGDSITEGVGSTTDGNNRWPDQFASNLQENRKYNNIAVANAGIGGNRICEQGVYRFEHDVLEIKGYKIYNSTLWHK